MVKYVAKEVVLVKYIPVDMMLRRLGVCAGDSGEVVRSGARVELAANKHTTTLSISSPVNRLASKITKRI